VWDVRRDDDRVACVVMPFDAGHPQAQLAGQNLEALLLTRMEVVTAGRPASIADPVDLKQMTVRGFCGLSEDCP
jgi:hypothetical protein